MITTPIEGKAFGATITGVKLETLTDAGFAEIRSALLEFGLCSQAVLADEGNIALGSRFWEPGSALPLANQVRHRDGMRRRWQRSTLRDENQSRQ